MALTLLATTDTQIIRVVEALYNQKPGNTYLSNFQTFVTENGIDGFANAMAASFASSTDAELAAVVTANLGLTGDALTAGNAYLEAQFAADAAGRGKAVLDAMNALAGLESDATYGAAAASFNANVVASYEYSANTANTTVGVAGAGSSYTLTSAVDTLTGTTGGDTFTASYTTAGGMTYQSNDSVDGGEGADQLNVSVGTTGAAQAAALSNVETVKGIFTAAGTLSLLGATGVTSVNASGSTAVANITNMSSDVANLTMENTGQNATFAYTAAAVAGSSDSATLTLTNVTAGTAVVAGVETLNVVSTLGANALTALTAANATTLNISGDQTLNLGAANTVATTIDASAMTAALTVNTNNSVATTVTGGAGNDKITATGGSAVKETIDGGAGDDTITYTANLGSTDVINGGDGTDTLVSTFALLDGLTVPTTGALITNVEKATVSNAVTTGAQSITLANIQADLSEVTFGFAHAATALTDNTLGVVGQAGNLTVNIGGSLAANATILADSTLTVTDTGTATTDSVTINNTAVNSTNSQNLDIWGTSHITSTGYENVTLSTGTATGGNVSNDIDALTITPDATTADVSLTITGTNAANIAGSVTTTSTGALTIDASALTAQAAGIATFTLATTAQGTGGTATITGSAGQDAITVGNFASTINGGAGVDTIIGGTAADTISGGAGNDVLTGSGGNDTINGDDGDDAITATTAGNYTVTGGAGNDTLDLGGTATQLDSFDGGDGTDTLILNNTSVTAINALSVSNINTFNAGLVGVERLDFGSTLAQAVDLGRFDNISDIIIGGGNAGNTATAISGLSATNNVEIQATAAQNISFALATATGTADVLNINLDSNAAIDLTSAAAQVTAANIETINIVGDDKTATNASDTNLMQLIATKATTINVSGHDGLTLTNTGNTKVTTFDASGVTNSNAIGTDTAAKMAVTFTSANTSLAAQVSITGGAGDDVLQGNVGVDTISGGSGADTITATAGNDVSTGGAGNDTFAFTKALLIANSGTTATFDGGAGTDILDFNEDNVTNIVDADFRGITSVETLTTGDGTNNVVFGASADATGIKTVTGGTGADTLDFSSVDFDNAVTIDSGIGADVITLAAGTDQVATILASASGNLDADGLVVVDNGAAGNLDATDTLALTAAATMVTGFTVGTDKVNLAAFSLTGQDAVVTTAVADSLDDVANGEYALIYGTLAGTTLTVAASGASTHTVLIYDADTAGTQESDVIVLNGILTTSDLILV